MKKIKMRDVESYIARHEEFDAGSMRGMTTLHTIDGHLPADWFVALSELNAAGRLAYVVFSYATPIAWVDTEGGITIPPVRYSLTTTQHQYRVADALAMSGWNSFGPKAQTKFTEVRNESSGRRGGW